MQVRREPPLYRISAKNEIQILRELDGRCGTLKLLREFDHDGHVCMSFELLGDHLSDLLKQVICVPYLKQLDTMHLLSSVQCLSVMIDARLNTRCCTHSAIAISVHSRIKCDIEI